MLQGQKGIKPPLLLWMARDPDGPISTWGRIHLDSETLACDWNLMSLNHIAPTMRFRRQRMYCRPSRSVGRFAICAAHRAPVGVRIKAYFQPGTTEKRADGAATADLCRVLGGGLRRRCRSMRKGSISSHRAPMKRSRLSSSMACVAKKWRFPNGTMGEVLQALPAHMPSAP